MEIGDSPRPGGSPLRRCAPLSGPVRVKSAPTGPFHSGAVLPVPVCWLAAGTLILYLIPYFFSPVHRYLAILIFSEKKPPQLPLPISAPYFSPLAMRRASSSRPASSSGITQHNDAAPSRTTNSEDVDADQRQEPAPGGLTRFDVASFMINRMIGTGIFTNPPFVLWACGNQHLALWVWFTGGLFTLAWCVRPSEGRAAVSLTMIQPSFCVYVEYGMAWPHNGGDVLYVSWL